MRDPIGTPLGFKDLNTNKDLLETMAQLAGVWPDDRVLERLRDVADIVRTRVVAPPGSCHMYFNPDWTPIPDPRTTGRTCTRPSCSCTRAIPRRRNAGEGRSYGAGSIRTEYAWDRATGGIAFAGSTFGQIYFDDQIWFLNRKYWWPQTESLAGLLYLATKDGPGVYSDRLPHYGDTHPHEPHRQSLRRLVPWVSTREKRSADCPNPMSGEMVPMRERTHQVYSDPKR